MLMRKISSKSAKPYPFKRIACFPWLPDCPTLQNEMGVLSEYWTTLTTKYIDAIAIGSDESLNILFLQGSHPTIRIPLPSFHVDRKLSKEEEIPIKSFRPSPADSVNVAWALRKAGDTLEILVIFSYIGILYIFDMRAGALVGSLRGHGGPITSISVHPRHPYIISTTSRDFTTRIYNLNFKSRPKRTKPVWLPGAISSLAGPAHGLDLPEEEGSGVGRSIYVLMGGRSGGHHADVLAAAFHPELPIIATAGMDRAAKIWYIPFLNEAEDLKRADKPLFSSTMIHNARILSINWVTKDVLLTHSAAALFNPVQGQSSTEPGTITFWRWLGINRFFPPNTPHDRRERLAGCVSDYIESKSYRILSSQTCPGDNHLDSSVVSYSSILGKPSTLFVTPNSDEIIYTIVDAVPKAIPEFLIDDTDALNGKVKLADTTNTSEYNGVPVHIGMPPFLTGKQLRIPEKVKAKHNGNSEKIMTASAGLNGTVVIAATSHSSLFIWSLK